VRFKIVCVKDIIDGIYMFFSTAHSVPWSKLSLKNQTKI